MPCPEYEAFAEFYDYVVPYRSRPDVAFFVDLARACGGTVLEVGCGTGRILLPCARAGPSVVGLDLSAPMLTVLGQNLVREPREVRERVRVVHGDMRAFDLGERFALITMPFRSFQHALTPEDQQATLRCVRRHLADDGRFVLDLFNPSIPFLGDAAWGRLPISEPEFEMPDGRKVTRSYRVTARDFINQRQRVEFVLDVVHPDGRTEHRAEEFEIRYLFRFEAQYLLEREGFEVEALYSDYARTPYGTEYPGELVFVARKSPRARP
jgi:SAM-dependent methyltransferase